MPADEGREADDEPASATRDVGHGEDEWLRRREQLASRLQSQRAKTTGQGPGGQPSAGFQGMAQGLRLASEFVAGILVGAALGYFIDRFLGTAPFGLVIFLLLGFVAGVLNVLRSVSKTGGGPPPAAG